MRFWFLIFFLLPSLTLALSEEECGPVRLDQGSGPMAQLPVYDQLSFGERTDSNICYAIQASQLIDAQRFREKGKLPDQLSSPLSLAALSKSASIRINHLEFPPAGGPVKLFSLGLPSKVLEHVRSAEVCDQRWLNQFDGSFGLTVEEFTRLVGQEEDLRYYPSLRNFLEAAHREIKGYRESLPFLGGIFGRKEPQITEDFFSCYVNENVIPAKALLEAVKAGIEAAEPVTALHFFLKKFCTGHSFRVDLPQFVSLNRTDILPKGGKGVSTARAQGMLSAIDQQLKEGKPAGVDYCFALRTMGKDTPSALTDIKDFEQSGHIGVACPVHSSVIVGRRWKKETQSCELLVRDSFGPDCKERDGQDKFPWDCENGQFWVESSRLMKSTLRVSHFK